MKNQSTYGPSQAKYASKIKQVIIRFNPEKESDKILLGKLAKIDNITQAFKQWLAQLEN